LNKNIILISLLAFCVFILPTVINYSSVENKTDRFFERIDGNFDDCVKNAGEDSRDIHLCKEIKKSSELAFNSAKSVSNINSNTSILQTVLFVIAIIILNFKERIKKLETK
jgi:hypothetical protein